ncbi:alpha/beta hydrolase [Collimonas pratensis]|uniref:Alpha/beta hydrolase fold family protein n=1 Tax=Collimonas pratensis TaxID=279113 RepID=A0A127Q673_9BURK|nr:alpha/beta hydrolase [Collimonas pratensis]AMP05521.1 alpha/beta hydrolase fold family protein [Collimonas pratensis]
MKKQENEVILLQVKPNYNLIPGLLATEREEKAPWANDVLVINNITVGSIAIFPAKNIASGKAVIVCPGGGYGVSAFSHEGLAVAKELSEAGITAFALKFRLPSDNVMTHKEITPLQDLQQAILYVRQNAYRWNINPDQIGTMGFSAGGHLVATAASHYDINTIENPQHINLRPDFMVLVYPVISFQDNLVSLNTRQNLLSNNPTQDQKDYFSNELYVTANTPPTYLVHAKDDDTVKVENSIVYYEMLQRKKIPSQLYLYKNGGHGFGLINPASNIHWMNDCLKWIAKMQ